MAVPMSIKFAVTAGALAGATLAVVNNKENVLRGAEYVLQKGADFCKQRLEKAQEMNMHFAESHEDSAFASGYTYSENGDSTGNDTPDDMDSDRDYATTPDVSDMSDSSDEEIDMISLD